MATTAIGSSGITYPNGATNGGYINSGTATAVSGTATGFTGIPSWVRKITLSLYRVQINSGSVFIIQLGSGSYTTTGYASAGTFIAPSTNVTNQTTGIAMSGPGYSSNSPASGVMILANQGSNVWVGSGFVADSNNTQNQFGAGSITLGGTLDRIQLTTSGGVTFTAGQINILYE